MNETKRVGVISKVDVDGKVVEFLGYGNYLGEYPMEGADDLGFADLQVNVPHIRLDCGETVCGIDASYWSSEDSMKESLIDYENRGFIVKNLR